MLKYFVPLGGFLLLVALLAAGLKLDPREVPSPFIGRQAPAFEANQLEAAGMLASTSLKGDVWLLNVWASWCGECQREHAVLTELIKGQNLKAVGLNYKDVSADAKRWIAQFGNPFTQIITDPQGKIGLEWGVYGTPETFIIDQQGIIRYKHIGPMNQKAVTEKILPLLAELRKEAGQ
ncbi:DsbE family thiol:disulfide interchange protein [Thiothrix fructosivorans]|uniref:DsbE family thiol:disulfide interchange protein n=1 Tax=Thiothrix fructosivorans TaxID=111770 RepID=A0A8B0SI17_9GAMM|nr:DsbE family thiol:disulfide interchange protein [Thiothrix fructosivorans]MBO0615323.1 DsbE family thiol:disulfide interchange protein [Thiothrix fructosivorans]QTX10100.1 DsbE family thiol:disulfide interchange protein [Thiothrix fructosivorans]